MGRFIRRHPSDGSKPYRVWKPSVPRLPDQILNGTVYLYRSEREARDGSAQGGSGVLVQVTSKAYGNSNAYVVTNRHVVAGGFTVVRALSTRGNTKIWSLNKDEWLDHPDGDDLTASFIDVMGEEETFVAVQEELFLSKDKAEQEAIGVGDDVFMVSRLLGRDGLERNEPIVRFGNLALGEPAKMRQDGPRNGIQQESYLVEMRSVSGHSGSPAFLLLPHGSIRPNAPRPRPRTDFYFLGVDWGHVPSRHDVLDSHGSPTGKKVDLGSNIATVVPAWKVGELLNVPEFIEQRRKQEEDYERRQDVECAAVLDAEPVAEFDQQDFEAALRKASQRIKPSQSGEEKS